MVDENEYQNAASTFEYRCIICGNTGNVNFGSLVSGRKCRSCMGLSKKTTYQFKDEIYRLVGDEYTVIGKYTGNKDKILMRHNKCNHEWNSTPINFLYGERRCPKCMESKGEKQISLVLDKLDILYSREYKFDDCVHIHQLRFDFYLPLYNMVIEFQGRQHYESVEFMGGDDEFDLRKKRDNIKRNYCKANNINLLEIPYLEYKNIEKIINDVTTNCDVI